MSGPDTIESYLIRCEVPHEQVDDKTWILGPDRARNQRVLLVIQDPIVLASAFMIEIDADTKDQEGLYRKLLELNAQLMACSYGLQDNRVVLSGAHQLESFDINEFQALIDDLMLALDTHADALRAWMPETG